MSDEDSMGNGLDKWLEVLAGRLPESDNSEAALLRRAVQSEERGMEQAIESEPESRLEDEVMARHRLLFRLRREGLLRSAADSLRAGGEVPLYGEFRAAAAASRHGLEPMLVKGEPGVYELEIFVPLSQEDRQEGIAEAVVTFNREFASNYEGRAVTLVVIVDGKEQPLAHGVVEGGEFSARVSLRGLDLQVRNPVNIHFGEKQ